MDKNEILEIAKNNNGYLYSQLIKQYNIPTIYITRLVKEGKLTKVYRGIYITNDGIEDIFYIYNLVYKKLVYSGDTALFLNGLSNKQYPSYEATFPYGTNLPNIQDFKMKQSRKSNFYLGISDVTTPFGNVVRTYDKERCICDLFIRPEYYDAEDRVYAINEYKRQYLDYKKLYDYAEKLKVLEQVKNVFEVIGWN